MRIVRVFPRRTSMTPDDSMAFVGNPPLPFFLPEADEVHVSTIFTWDIEESHRLAEAWRQHYPTVYLGGPAFNTKLNGFTPGMYIKHGVTFTTTGCNHNCPWCLVSSREGRLVERKDFAPGYIVQDNNLLQASKGHILRVFSMLKAQRRAATFSGGLEARLVNPWLVEQLQSLRINQLFLAADTRGALVSLAPALKLLSDLPRRKLRVYVLIGFNNETLEEADARLREVWSLGGLPFAQLYQPPDHYVTYPWQWKQLARIWSRPAAMFSLMRTSALDDPTR